MDPCSLKPCVKPTVKNRGVIMDSDFKLDKQVSDQMWRFPAEAHLIWGPLFDLVILKGSCMLFISTQLGYCNARYDGVGQASRSRAYSWSRMLHLVFFNGRAQARAKRAPVLTGLPLTGTLCDFRLIIRFYCLPTKPLTGLAPASSPSELLQSHFPSKVTRVRRPVPSGCPIF